MNKTKAMAKKKNPLVFMDVSIDGDPVERMLFELFYDVAPKTSDNFRALSTGERGISPNTGKSLHYKGSFFHRVIKGSIVKGGDFVNRDGTGGESIYGSNFPDESPRLKHDAPGLLSMAIADRDTLGSHFIITLKADHHLDRKNVVFGKLVEGLQVLKRIEDVGDNEGYPSVTVKIINCGEYNQDLSTSSKSRSITPKRRLSKSPSLSRSRPRPPRRNFSTSPVRVIGRSRSRSISRSPVRGRRGRNVSRSPVITRPLKSVSKNPIRSHRRRSSPRASSRKTISRSPVRVSRKNVSRSPVRSPARSLSKSPVRVSGKNLSRGPVRSTARSLSRSSGRVPSKRSISRSPVRAPSRSHRHNYSRSPGPARRTRIDRDRYSNYRRYSPRRFRSPPPRGRTPPRYRRRSRTPSVRAPSRSNRHNYSRSPGPARRRRSYWYSGRTDRDRYSNYRRYSPRRFRSPPSRGRTPPRYRRRSRTPFVSPSRRYSSSRNPVHIRSPVRSTSPDRSRPSNRVERLSSYSRSRIPANSRSSVKSLSPRRNYSRSPGPAPWRRSYWYSGRTDCDRYSNYRRYSPRHLRSPPPHGRTPPRYRRRSRTPFVSPSRRYCSSRSPVHIRSPVRSTSPDRSRPSRSSIESPSFIGPMSSSSKRAVLVGLRYINEKEFVLDSPWADADGFYDALTSKCDYPPEDIILIEDKDQDHPVNSLFILYQLEKIERESNFGDLIFILFAGHSKLNINGELCFYTRFGDSLLPGSELKVILTRMAKKCVVAVVLDMCNAKALLGELPKMESDSTGLIVFTACTEVEEARNVLVHGSDISYGVLTCHLLRQIFINEPMTYDELFTAAEIDVNNLCQRMVNEGYGGAQHIGIQVTHANLVHRKFAC